MKRRKFISIAVLASFSLILSSCFKPSPAKTVEKFMRSLEKGEVNEAMEMLSSSATQFVGEDKTRLALYETVKSIQQKGGIKSYKLIDETVKGDFATVKFITMYKNGSEEKNILKLIKKDNEWKIDLQK